jgi:hypothetical protein
MTLGPIGTVAHPPITARPDKSKRPRFQFILPPPPLLIGRGCIWHYLFPTARTVFDVWVVALSPFFPPIASKLEITNSIEEIARFLPDT